MRSSEETSSELNDTNSFADENLKGPRFNKLNPDAIRELINNSTSFDYVKEIAIGYLEETISDQLDIFALEGKCDFLNIEKYSKNIFAWRSKKYLERRELENSAWIDIMRVITKEDCLETFKLHTNLMEIKAFLKLIFQGFLSSEDNFDLEALLYEPLREAERNLVILETLYDNVEKLKENLKYQKYYITDRFYKSSPAMEQIFLVGVEESMTRAQTLDRIKMRYQINWHESQMEQIQFRSDLRRKNIEGKIDELELKKFMEEVSGDSIRNTYYGIIEEYKSKIDVLQNRFNSKLEEIENEINYIRLESSKLEEQQHLLTEAMEGYQQEIKNRLEKEEREREKQRLESERLEELKRIEEEKQRKARKMAKLKRKLEKRNRYFRVWDQH